MTEINETSLPGVGVRHDFTATGGDRVGVVSHHAGRRELLIYNSDDPDSVAETANLAPVDARALADLLGGPSIVERFDDLRQNIHGLAIDWLPVAAVSPRAGRRLADIGLRARTGVSVVAIIRDETGIPSPGPEDKLLAGDVAVVVGTPEGIDESAHLLSASAA